jgi:aryl-alcohol dehydrogenase-like predicted oxidoreductase
VPYSPLGRGFLTGAFADASKDVSSSDFRQLLPRFTGDNAKANAVLLAPLHKIAADHGVTTAQIALAWVQQRAHAHGLTVVPIPGTRKRSRLLENAAATRITLSAESGAGGADRRPGSGRPLLGHVTHLGSPGVLGSAVKVITDGGSRPGDASP